MLYLYPIDLSILGVDPFLAVLFLLDAVLLAIAVGAASYSFYRDYKKKHSPKFQCAGCIFKKRQSDTQTASILDLQRALLAAIAEAQAKQV